MLGGAECGGREVGELDCVSGRAVHCDIGLGAPGVWVEPW